MLYATKTSEIAEDKEIKTDQILQPAHETSLDGRVSRPSQPDVYPALSCISFRILRVEIGHSANHYLNRLVVRETTCRFLGSFRFAMSYQVLQCLAYRKRCNALWTVK